MRPDLRNLLEAQAHWQKSRSRLSWPEKVRMAEVMREAARKLRARPPCIAHYTAEDAGSHTEGLSARQSHNRSAGALDTGKSGGVREA